MSNDSEPTTRSLSVPRSQSLALRQGNSLVTRGLQDLQAIVRIAVLHFPREFSLGEIIVGRVLTTEATRYFGCAQGDIAIPWTEAGLKVSLMLGEGSRPHLRTLRQLESNSLWGLEMAWDYYTDDELENVSHLTGLRELSVVGLDELSDAGLQHLAGMESLTGLDLASLMVTDNGILRLLRCLPGLSYLSICCPRLTDAFFEGLIALPLSKNLTELHFMGGDSVCSVSSRGWSLIGQLSKLRDLCVDDWAHHEFTSHALESVKRALPHCRIDVTPTG